VLIEAGSRALRWRREDVPRVPVGAEVLEYGGHVGRAERGLPAGGAMVGWRRTYLRR
jgi:hypothetical protein